MPRGRPKGSKNKTSSPVFNDVENRVVETDYPGGVECCRCHRMNVRNFTPNIVEAIPKQLLCSECLK